MSNQENKLVQEDKKEGKCPLGFSGWFGKKPQNLESKTVVIQELQQEQPKIEIISEIKEVQQIVQKPSIKEQAQKAWNQIQQLNIRYKQLPEDLTSFKKQNVFSIESTNLRVMMLMGLTVPTVLISRYLGSLKMMRNTVIVYFGFGLILAPEIFSSKLKKG